MLKGFQVCKVDDIVDCGHKLCCIYKRTLALCFFPKGDFFLKKIFRASSWWVLGVEVVFLWRQCSSERQIVMMCWQAHWLFLNQWEFFRQDRENILTECVLSENARKSPIIPWMIVKPLKMVKTRVVHAGPADEVCRIIWMAWNKKGNRQETLSPSRSFGIHWPRVQPGTSALQQSFLLTSSPQPAPHSSSPLLWNTAQLRKYRVFFKLCLPQKWLKIWFRAGHTWYLVHHRTISAIKKYDRKSVCLLQNM